jgi:hypothetical protein
MERNDMGNGAEGGGVRPRCLDAALEYARQGFSVILLQGIDDEGHCTCGKPGCYSAGKHPIGRSWKQFQNKRQTPEELIEAFKKRPDANVGIVTGEISGILVVDCDGPEGFESFCKVNANELPELPIVKTGKGYHFYGRHPGGKLKNFVKTHPGLDGRGDGGYVVAPPSRHADGHEYKWTKGLTSPLPDLLPNLLNLFTSSDKQSEDTVIPVTMSTQRKEAVEPLIAPFNGRAPAKLKQGAAEELGNQCRHITQAPMGQQEATLSAAGLKIGNYVGAALLEFGHARDALVEAGLQMQNAPGRPRWTRAEIAKKIADKLRVGMLSPKWGRDPRGEDEDRSSPLDIFGDTGLLEPPEFPLDALPDVLKAFVVDRAERLGVKPELIAMPALAVCAAAIDDRVVVQVRRYDQQWHESARIWIAIIEEPGGKKTPAINAAVSALRDIEAVWRSEDAPALQKYEIDLERYKAQLKKHCNDTDADDISSGLHQPAKPPMRRLVVTDTTTEALAKILAENPAGVLGVFDELAQLLGSFDAYRGGKSQGRDRAIWLELYNGGARAIDRAITGHLHVPNWSASIVGGIQPDRMRKLVKDLSEDGLLQRFIPVFGSGPGMGVDKPANEAADKHYRDTLQALAIRRQAKITLSPEAQDVRERLIRRIETLLKHPNILGALKNHLSKWEALFARLLLINHYVALTSLGLEPWELIHGDTACQVELLMLDYLLPNAMRFYSEFYGRDDHVQHACWVADHILAHRLPVITKRDVGRAYRTLRDNDQALERAMSFLESAGWIVPIVSGVGRRPSRWWVDPRVHRVFAKRAAQEESRRRETVQKFRETTDESDQSCHGYSPNVDTFEKDDDEGSLAAAAE